MNEKELIDFLVNDKSSLSQEEQAVQIITESSENSIAALIEIEHLKKMIADMEAAAKRRNDIINTLANK